MQISIKHSYVFLCQPKCASTAAEAMLRPHSDFGSLSGRAFFKHTNLRQYNRFLRPYVEQGGGKTCETICLMREPVSWLASFYKYRSRDAIKDPNHPNHHRSTAELSFSEFVEGYLSEERPPFASVGSQLAFLCDEEGNVGVDRVFAYEKVQEFVEYMEMKIGKSLDLPIANRSPDRAVDTLPETLRNRLHASLSEEIRVYESLL